MKNSVYIATSLDGFIARKDGALDWLPGSDEANNEPSGDEDFGFNAFMASVDALVMGRKTFEIVVASGHWFYDKKRVVVLSRTLTRLPASVPDTVEIRAGSPAVLVADLAAEGVKHIYVDGGQTIQQFLNADLIDDITITRVPVIIGNGIPLFEPVERDIKLKHLETKAFSNGFVQSHYRVKQ